jgi:hypothetical protein
MFVSQYVPLGQAIGKAEEHKFSNGNCIYHTKEDCIVILGWVIDNRTAGIALSIYETADGIEAEAESPSLSEIDKS